MANETSGIKKYIESLAGDPAEKKKQLDALDKLQDAIKERRAAAADDIETLSSITKSALDAIRLNMDDIQEQFKENRKTQAEYREELAKLKKIKGELTEEQKKDIAFYEKEIPLLQEKIQGAKQLLIVEKSNKTVIEESNRALKEKLGLGYEMNDSFLGSIFASDNAFKGLKASVMENLEPQKLLASGLKQVQDASLAYAKAFDNSSAQLAQATATTGEYNSTLNSVAMSNRAFNVDVEKAQQSISALNNTMSSFSNLNTQQQAALAQTSARLSALGVSADTAAQSFDIMIQSLGMSEESAQSAQMELVGLSSELKVSADVINKDFAQASSEMAKYGKSMMREFKALQGAAKATGVSFSSLMNITKQFDTFEGAATHAGKLNAILGGGVINSMDLLNATEEERVRLLIQSVKASGKNFDNMNRFEKQAIMSAAGITDMNEAQKLFNQSLSEYDAQVASAKTSEATNEQFAEMASAATNLGDKLSQIGNTFVVSFSFMLPYIHSVADALLTFSDYLAENVPFALAGAGVAILAFGYTIYKTFGMAKKFVKEGVKSMAEDVGEGLGKGVEKASQGASSGIKMFAKALKKASKPIAKALQVIGRGAMSAAPGLIAMGVGLIKVGLGVALIVLPIALLVASIAMLINSVITLAKEVGGGQLLEIAGAFYLFALGLGQGLGLVSLAFAAFAATLVAVSYTSIGVLPILTAGLLGVAAVVAALTASLLLLPNQKLISLSVASEGIAKVMEASVKLTPEAVSHTKEIVTAAADYVKVQAEMLSPDADAFVQALRGAFGGGGSEGGQDIVLVLNDREFARAVNVALNRTNNLSID